MPKIEGANSRYSQVCVDGKQRLSSVRAFVQGKIPCNDHRGQRWWFTHIAGVTGGKKTLPEETQKLFLNKDFVTYEFFDLSAEQEEDLFARVQMGMQLTPAERLRASTGPWQQLAKLFVDDFPTIYELLKDRSRGRDFQLTLMCFSQIIEIRDQKPSDGVPRFMAKQAALPQFLGKRDLVNDGAKSHLASVWNIMKDMVEEEPDIFNNATKWLSGVQTFAPVEMVAITVLISMHFETRDIQTLLDDVKALRMVLRERYQDLRLNSSIWSFLHVYLKDLEATGETTNGTPVTHVVEAPRATVLTEPETVPHSAMVPAQLSPRSNKPSTIEIPGSLITPATARRAIHESQNRTGSTKVKRKRMERQHYDDPFKSNQDHHRATPYLFSVLSDLAIQESGTPVSPPSQPRISNDLHNTSQHATQPLPWTSTAITQQRAPNLVQSSSMQYPPRTRHHTQPQTRLPEHGASTPAIPPSKPPSKPRIVVPEHTDQQWNGILSVVSPPPSTLPPRAPVPPIQRPISSVQRPPPPTAPLRSPNSPAQRTPSQRPPPQTPQPHNPLPQRPPQQPSNEATRPPSKKRKSSNVSRPTPAQLDAVIDLTSDGELEQERREILSSFKPRSTGVERVAAGAMPAPMVPVPPGQQGDTGHGTSDPPGGTGNDSNSR